MFIFVSALKIYYYAESLKNQIEAILLTSNIFQSYLYISTKFSKNVKKKMSKKPENQSYTICYNAFAFAHNLL